MNVLPSFEVPPELKEILAACPGYVIPDSIEAMADLSVKDAVNGWQEVEYGFVKEARVCRVKNGISVNFYDPYMRRREPDCLFIGDELPTDRPRYKDAFKMDFAEMRKKSFDWLKTQPLAVFPLYSGQNIAKIHTVCVAPMNAGFFALALALLQGMLKPTEIPKDFKPKAVIYVVPPFRNTYFNGKQVVVHNRMENLYEIFSFNLYPGPSAKKGVYGLLIHTGEMEKWVAPHCSAVQVVTPYNNKVTIMHEGASGGGKSELLENIHREIDGSICLGQNIITEDKRFITLPKGCSLRPVIDDMGLFHPSIQNNSGKIVIFDAEYSWFFRVDNITHYGTDPDVERLSISPPTPLLFMNIDAQPGSTALVWEHIEDTPGKKCPNPRVIFPREIFPNVVKKPVAIDIRSFGVRCPPCTKENPTYGILGLFHVLPPALAWLWRLVAPRGHANPSVTSGGIMDSEGVGSYWPFATGLRVNQANLLLESIMNYPKVQYVLCPNRHLGSWKVGFMPEWLMREFIARRGGAGFRADEAEPAKCALLGYSLKKVVIEGQSIDRMFLAVERQPEVGSEAYEKGADMLYTFFHKEIKQFLVPELNPIGKQIIECCLRRGSLAEYEAILKSSTIIED